MKNYYEALGLNPGATEDEIRAAHKLYAAHYHPDKGNGDEAKCKAANEAYMVLKDPNLKRVYDQELSAELSARSNTANVQQTEQTYADNSKNDDEQDFLDRLVSNPNFIIVCLIILIISMVYSGHNKKETLLKQHQPITTQQVSK